MPEIPPTGSVAWQSPSNIALVKYWGKHGQQLPVNPSLSITLRESVTRTKVNYQAGKDRLQVDFLFQGKPEEAFGERIRKFLRSQAANYPILDSLYLQIDSSNTFPHSSGIASSASSFSALALCVLTIIRKLTGEPQPGNFLREASQMARLGSGSAGRSVYPGYVVWGEMKDIRGYSDHYAVPLQAAIHPEFRDLQDAILIVSAAKKKIGSSAGHALMNEHPYLDARVAQAQRHMIELHDVLQSGELDRFIDIVENEALSLHGLMLASLPGYLLMEEATYRVIETVREYRSATGIPVCFTLDAGPNVHLLYPHKHRKEVRELISDHLAGWCSDGRWIDDGMGDGPTELK